jgi:hypothetical protein
MFLQVSVRTPLDYEADGEMLSQPKTLFRLVRINKAPLDKASTNQAKPEALE